MKNKPLFRDEFKEGKDGDEAWNGLPENLKAHKLFEFSDDESDKDD